MAAEGGAIITFIFNGEDRRDIPRNVTHLIVHENITIIPADLFYKHPNLIEVYCHAGVTKIDEWAFFRCPSLRRVIIPGVVVVEEYAFHGCKNLVYVECDKLDRIGARAFSCCALSSINLPSAKIVERDAFSGCSDMTETIFGKDLESIRRGAFCNCRSLESITIPLRNDLFTRDDIFKGCNNLEGVNLVEGEYFRAIALALLLEYWKSDLNEVLDSINHTLIISDPGSRYYDNNVGGKAIAIREWIESVLRKVTHYKASHRELLDEAATVLQLSLPNDIVMNNILPFFELPSLTLDGEDGAD